MTIGLGDVIDDHELEQRLRTTLSAVMPLLDRHTDQLTGESLEDLDPTWVEVEGSGGSPRRARSVVAALSLVAAAVAVFVVLTQREPVEEPVGNGPATTSVSAAGGDWYDIVRPFLPDGFDQIALMHAGDDAVVFRAWRTGTGQILDVTIGLRSGDLKETSDTVTDIDASGTWYETTSDATLITNDGRLIGVSCGVLVDSGGTGISESARDYCGDEFDHAGIGPTGRRAIVTALATQFPTTTPDAAFGIPAHPTADPDSVAAVITEVLPNVNGTVVGSQWDGLVQYINLTAGPGPAKSELSIVHGVRPPRAADANPAFAPLPATDPSSRMVLYDDIAIGWMVNDDGIGYHIATTDVSADNLGRLGILLERLSGLQSNDGVSTFPAGPSTTLDPRCLGGRYTVIDGDNLAFIAAQFDSTVEAILAANGWSDVEEAVIFPGQEIIVPTVEDPTNTTGFIPYCPGAS